MPDKQSKNTIKALIAVILALVIGEGVFGYGVYWPFLFLLLGNRVVYWLALAVGVTISAMHKIPVGFPSLFLVASVALVSMIFGSRKEAGVITLGIAIALNLFFDKLFGLSWGVTEVIVVVIAWLLSDRWSEQDAIKLSY